MRTRQRNRIIGLIVLFALMSTVWATAAGQTGTAAASKQEVRIKGWQVWAPAPVPDSPQYGDHVMFRVAEEKFGIYIDWTTVASEGQTALGLLIASGDLPDLIGRNFGPTFAQDYGRQGAFIKLEGYIEKHGPTLTALMNKFPAIRGQTVAPDGSIYFFPRTMEDLPRSWPGYQIRKDWLDKLGLKMPETMAELEVVLRAFRDRDPNGNGQKDEVPWTTDPRSLLWTYGVGSRGFNNPTDLFVEDGVIRAGTSDPRFRDALALVSRWYAEGLIDPEYLGQTGAQLNTLVLSDRAGAVLGSFAGYLTNWNKLFRADGKPGVFVAMPPPQGLPGIRNMMGGHKELDPACGASITVASKYPAQITEMMDYFYSDEGRMFIFFGREGEHYVMKDGAPVYTDKVAAHPTMTVMNILNTYIGFISVWPSFLPSHHQLSLYDQEGKDALRLSARHETDRKMPNLQFTAEELREVQEISRDLNTYTDEWVHGFIRGQKPLTQWDEFQTGLRRLRAPRLAELYNAAYTRYKRVASGG